MKYIEMSFCRVAAIVFLLCLFSSGCFQESNQLVDPDATPETKALYRYLRDDRKKGILFGHQDALAYGVFWKKAEFRSDVHDVCGKFPAVFGWDLSKIELQQSINIDSVPFGDMRKWILEVFQHGGINTISWHMDNPVSGGDSWDVTKAVTEILPGGSKHDHFKQYLDRGAAFLLSLKDEQNQYVPVIFRPWHENDGNWFWWGSNSCSAEEYKALWKFTVQYLRDKKGIHHLIYAYSWGGFSDEVGYFTRYPGHAWVDLLGTDDYGDLDDEKSLQQLRVLVQMAKKYNKIAALTESGSEGIKNPEWFTEKCFNPIKNDPIASGISYFLVWRNANIKHHYAPFPGHPATPSFMEMEQDSGSIFLEDLPDVYNFNVR